MLLGFMKPLSHQSECTCFYLIIGALYRFFDPTLQQKLDLVVVLLHKHHMTVALDANILQIYMPDLVTTSLAQIVDGTVVVEPMI